MKVIVDYLVETFKIDSNTSATIVITLSVFILGYVFNWINSFVTSFRTRRNFRKLFQAITKSIIYGVKQQIKNFEKSSATLSINNHDDYFLQTGTITHLDNVDRLDFTLVYNSYFQGLENIFSRSKLKAFNKSFGWLSVIKDTENRIYKDLDDFSVKFSEHENNWNAAVEQIRQFNDNLHTQVDGGTFPVRIANYITRIDLAFFRWQNLENRTEFAICHNELISPLIAINRLFPDILLTLNYNTLLLHASHHFDNMNKTLSVYSGVFQHRAITYRVAWKMLEKSVSILKTPAIVLLLLQLSEWSLSCCDL